MQTSIYCEKHNSNPLDTWYDCEECRNECKEWVSKVEGRKANDFLYVNRKRYFHQKCYFCKETDCYKWCKHQHTEKKYHQFWRGFEHNTLYFGLTVGYINKMMLNGVLQNMGIYVWEHCYYPYVNYFEKRFRLKLSE